MAHVKSQPQTAVQKLRAKQKVELAKYPRGSKERSRAIERHKRQLAKLREEQHLVARARDALPKSKRKKLGAVRYLSPDTIRKEAERIKREGARLRRKREYANPLRPPTNGYTTSKTFEIPGQLEGMRTFLNKVYERYYWTGQERGEIRGIRAIIYYADGFVASTGIMEPVHMKTKDDAKLFLLDQVATSDPTIDLHKLKVSKITIIVSWNRDYL